MVVHTTRGDRGESRFLHILGTLLAGHQASVYDDFSMSVRRVTPSIDYVMPTRI